MAKTGRSSDQFQLRLPDGLKDRIKIAAEANNRSINAEIVATLEGVYPDDGLTVTYRTLKPVSFSVETLQTWIQEVNRGIEEIKTSIEDMERPDKS